MTEGCLKETLEVLGGRVAEPFCEMARQAEPGSQLKPLRDQICQDFKTVESVFQVARGMGRGRAVKEWGRLLKDIVPEPGGAAFVSRAAPKGSREGRRGSPLPEEQERKLRRAREAVLFLLEGMAPPRDGGGGDDDDDDDRKKGGGGDAGSAAGSSLSGQGPQKKRKRRKARGS